MQLQLGIKKPTQKERILKRLQATGQVSNVELNHICFRYGARIHELRREGYVIETGPKDRYGRVIFKYIGKEVK